MFDILIIVARVVCVLGLFVVLGAAGNSDCGIGTDTEIMIQGVVGLLMFVFGGLLGGVFG